MNVSTPPPFVSPLNCKKPHCQAFTLLELSIGLTILAILCGMILVATGKLTARGATAGCLNNLRTWGVAVALYTAEHNGELPMNQAPDDPSGEGGRAWQDRLAPYANTRWLDARDKNAFLRSPMACPAEKNLEESTNAYFYCYGMNNDLNYRLRPKTARMRLASLSNASQFVVLADSFNTNILYADKVDKLDASSKMMRRHDGIPNFLYADGHVEPFTKEILGTSDARGTADQKFYYQLWFANGIPPNDR